MTRKHQPFLVPGVREILDACLPLAPGAEPVRAGRALPRFPKVARESSEPAAEAATTGGSPGSVGGAKAGRGRSSAEAPTGGTESEKLRAIALQLLDCSLSWDPGARLLGNITSRELAQLALWVVDRLGPEVRP